MPHKLTDEMTDGGIYEVTEDNKYGVPRGSHRVTEEEWLAPGWYIDGRECFGVFDTREEAEAFCDLNGF